MKNNSITQRLKGLIQNLEKELGSYSITPLRNAEYGTLRYSFDVEGTNKFGTVLNIDFKASGEHAHIPIPLEEQTATFVFKVINLVSGATKTEVATKSFDLESARSFLRSINQEVKKSSESEYATIILSKINESNDEKEIEHSSVQFKEEMADAAHTLEVSKETYYKSIRELNSARLKAQAEYKESEELKAVRELQAQLNIAQSKLRERECSINEKYNLEELRDNHQNSKSNWIELKEEFSNQVLKICRKFSLPLTMAKTYQAIKELDKEQIKVVGNNLTRFF